MHGVLTLLSPFWSGSFFSTFLKISLQTVHATTERYLCSERILLARTNPARGNGNCLLERMSSSERSCPGTAHHATDKLRVPLAPEQFTTSSLHKQGCKKKIFVCAPHARNPVRTDLCLVHSIDIETRGINDFEGL